MKWDVLLALMVGVVGMAVEASPSSQRYVQANPQAPTSPSVVEPGFDYATQKVRGVNLGGWLVLEPWITPSLFDQFGLDSGMIDEYTLSQKLGREETIKLLTPHWENWITFSDLEQIKNHGLNHIRIPIGYWSVAPLDGDPYVQGQIQYLDHAVQWAKQLGLKVWIDLHGAPGSQNGFDNSGQRDRLEWQSTAGFVEHTLKAVGELARRYATPELAGTVTGIEILNEPLGPKLDLGRIKQFWQDGYRVIRNTGTNSNVIAIIQDAFQPPQSWNGFMPPPEYRNVLLDVHHYQVFTPGLLSMTEQQHIDQACGVGWDLRGVDKWVVVGEWSGAFTDCAKWLNGYPTGSRYQGEFGGSPYIGNCGLKTVAKVEQLPEQERDRIRRVIEAQLDAYEQGTGWIFWTWKTEGAPEWDMQNLLEQGVFPEPGNPADRRWPAQCGF
ncbi:glycoside hydrolase superfamily [Kalaharituber pfeilii]|nr:glycoside hydrolase superfamily [Kalaharituber pfeilii]